MEQEEDDDFYGGEAGESTKQEDASNGQPEQKDTKMEDSVEEGEEEDEEDDESDSDSLEIITDRADLPQVDTRESTQPQLPLSVKSDPQRKVSSSEIPAQPKSQPAPKPLSGSLSTAAAHQKPGTAYPEIRNSTIEVDADPTYPPVGKPISEVNLEADFAESSKPWRLPGSDLTDYFNYGFDEFTWSAYTVRQQTMNASRSNIQQESQAFMAGGGMPMMPGMAPPGPGGAPTGPAGAAGGMPGMDDQGMMAMMQQMMASGIDPSQMDFNTFMQNAQSMGGGGGVQPQVPGGQQGFGAQGQQYGGYGGGGQQGGGNFQSGGGGRRGGRGGRW